MATKADIAAVRAEMATNADVATVKAEMATNAVATVSANLDTVKAEMATKAGHRGSQGRDGDQGRFRNGQREPRHRQGEMATKADLHREIAASEARMEQRLQNAILEAKVSLIKWMIATMAVFSGIVIWSHDRLSIASRLRSNYSTRQSRNASSTAAWMLRLETASPIRKS